MTASRPPQEPDAAIAARVVTAIAAVRAAFGAPGDWGYSQPEGKALYALYAIVPDLHGLAGPRPTAPSAEGER